MKFCKDCEYYGEDYNCCHEKNVVIHMVTGDVLPTKTMYKLRYDISKIFATLFDLCGPQGRWYEPRIQSNVVPINKQGETDVPK